VREVPKDFKRKTFALPRRSYTAKPLTIGQSASGLLIQVLMKNDQKSRDEIFNSPQENIAPFEFNQKVAEVFDDMVARSIPFYQEIHRLIVDLTHRYYQGRGKVYDLGCSTGTTIELLERSFGEKPISFVGVDTSGPMLEFAKKKCSHVRQVDFLLEDMTEVDFQEAEVVIFNYTLQFLKVDKRAQLLRKIYDALLPGGCLILSEKIKSPSEKMESCITDLYYDFKRRNGYSELEISQKREALENVLVPLSPHEQITMLEEVGFNAPEMLFRWYNFASYLALKD
jgi:tRNA (cmo5U34)-methyltransferase